MRRRGMICAILLMSQPVIGQAPVGPSTARLDGSRFGLSVEYGRTTADVLFDVDGRDQESLDFQTAFADFSVALTSRWEFFLRLGGSQAETTGFNGDWDVAWGMGTRFTAFQWHALSWGASAQFTNLMSDADTIAEFLVDGTPTLLSATDELKLVEYVLATGPTWQQGPLSLYGGPLLRYVHGELETIAGRLEDRFAVHGRWDAGGYVGAGVTLFRTDPAQTYGFSRCDLRAEGRFTGDSTGFTVGLLLPFGGAY